MKSHNHLYDTISIMISDSDLENFITTVNSRNIYDIVCYLENRMYYQFKYFIHLLLLRLEIIDTTYLEKIANKIIDYHILCSNKNLNFADVLIVCKHHFNKIGGYNSKKHSTKKSHGNIILKGISSTLKSILEKKYDKDRIDNNLRKGAMERKEYLLRLRTKKGRPKKSKSSRRKKYSI